MSLESATALSKWPCQVECWSRPLQNNMNDFEMRVMRIMNTSFDRAVGWTNVQPLTPGRFCFFLGGKVQSPLGFPGPNPVRGTIAGRAIFEVVAYQSLQFA